MRPPAALAVTLAAGLLAAAPRPAAAQAVFRAPIVGQSRAEVSASAHHTLAVALPTSVALRRWLPFTMP